MVSDEPAGPRRRVNWGLAGFALSVAGAGWLVGTLFDAGPAATLAAVTALFVGFGATGGSLRADLRLLLVAAPAFVTATVLPRTLTAVSVVAALAAVAALVLLAGLLPSRGKRWATVGKGMALTTLMSYGMPLAAPATPLQLLAAAVAALVVAVVVRVAMSGGDPSGPVRAKVARVVVSRRPDAAGAFVAWLQDRPTVWLGDALTAAVEYRALRAADPADDVDAVALDGRAREVAGLIAAKAPNAGTRVGEWSVPQPLGGSTRTSAAMRALGRARATALARDGSAVPLPPGTRRRLVAAVWASPLTWRSDLLRHAVRTTFAFVLAALLALAVLPQGHPLVPSLLLTTYSVLHSTRSATLAQAWRRIGGVAVGAGVAVVTLCALPPEALLPVALAALVVWCGTVITSPPTSYAAYVVVALGMNAGARGLDPEASLGGYLLLVAAALVIGVIVAFAVVPGTPRRTIDERVSDARAALALAVEGFADWQAGLDGAGRLQRVTSAMRAVHALDEAGPGRERPDVPAVERRSQLVDVAAALVAVAGLVAREGGPHAQSALTAAAAHVRGEETPRSVTAETGNRALLLTVAGEFAASLGELRVPTSPAP